MGMDRHTIPAFRRVRTGDEYHLRQLDEAWQAAVQKTSYVALNGLSLSPDGHAALLYAHFRSAKGSVYGPVRSYYRAQFMLELASRKVEPVSVSGVQWADWFPDGQSLRLELQPQESAWGADPRPPSEFTTWRATHGNPRQRWSVSTHYPWDVPMPPKSDGLFWISSAKGAHIMDMQGRPTEFVWRGYRPGAEGAPAVTYTVPYPRGRDPVGGSFVAPGGRKIAWVFEYCGDESYSAPPLRQALEALQARGKHSLNHYCQDIWISDGAGHNLRYLGYFELADEKDYLEDIYWLPAARSISFKRNDVPYVVPADG
ncbi:MAG TPA: hypothetical protein VKT77_16015 [Chthonomonadaceae bacterium]|nr:hypothetical protein [Chthonomonadaceae bacterium]